jgi:hypothetical protein
MVNYTRAIILFIPRPILAMDSQRLSSIAMLTVVLTIVLFMKLMAMENTLTIKYITLAIILIISSPLVLTMAYHQRFSIIAIFMFIWTVVNPWTDHHSIS